MKPGKSVPTTHPKHLYLEGRKYHDQRNFVKAEEKYKSVLRLIPSQPDALHMLGVIAFEKERYSEAVQYIERATKIAPNNAVLQYNFGNALAKVGQLREATDALSEACKLDPTDLAALKNLGNAYKELNEFDKAIACYDKILSIDPNYTLAQSNKAIALLTLGKFSEGFDLYDSRLDLADSDQKFLFDRLPRHASNWEGNVPQKPLLVLPEQGLGDQIFYGGMLGDLVRLKTEAFVCLDGRLISLFARSFPELDFITKEQIGNLQPSEDLFGAQVMMGSMAKWLRRNEKDFQHIRSPYLKCDKKSSQLLVRDLKNPNRLLVGISWKSANVSHGLLKSCKLEDLQPILGLSQVDFIDLQYGDTHQERSEFYKSSGKTIKKVEYINNMTDIDELAALIDACDIVVTVSNTTAHLAAALGKPTLVLLAHHSPLWYWHKDEIYSPWYPTAVLIRQEVTGDWGPVILRAMQIIDGLTQQPQSPNLPASGNKCPPYRIKPATQGMKTPA